MGQRPLEREDRRDAPEAPGLRPADQGSLRRPGGGRRLLRQLLQPGAGAGGHERVREVHRQPPPHGARGRAGPRGLAVGRAGHGRGVRAVLEADPRHVQLPGGQGRREGEGRRGGGAQAPRSRGSRPPEDRAGRLHRHPAVFFY